MEYRCVICSDQSGELKFNTSYSFTWTDTDAGFTMKLADKTIHTSQDKFTAMHYFFVVQGGETYRFSCRDSSYQKKLKADYALFYEVITAHLFKGEEMTSSVKKEGTISLLDDEDKTVYYAALGLDEIKTKMLTISNSQKFEMRCILSPSTGNNMSQKIR